MRWQYRVVNFDMTERWSPKKQAEEIAQLEVRLNELGDQGWEMVSYETVQMFGSISNKLKGTAYLLFLKKPA